MILKINGRSKDLFSEPFTPPEGGKLNHEYLFA